jgi:Domain of unknown function (DUF4190)
MTSDNFGPSDQDDLFGRTGQPAPPPQYGSQPPQYGQAPQYGQTAPYGQPGYGPPAGARRNPLAIASLICGIAQVLLFALPLFSVAAIITGALGLRNVKAKGERGRGMAITGLVLGCLGLLLFLVAVVHVATNHTS